MLSGPWQDQCTLDDSEFVERYLNLHETSYDVAGVLWLVEQADHEFRYWPEPADWALEVLLPPGKALDHALTLELRERRKFVDELFWRPSIELLPCHPGNRKPAPASTLGGLQQLDSRGSRPRGFVLALRAGECEFGSDSHSRHSLATHRGSPVQVLPAVDQ